jgi:Xaa-Pro aminopeptidase
MSQRPLPLPAEVFAARRIELARRLGRPVLLLGNGLRARNLPKYSVEFRQDSTFLYFTGCAMPNAAALIDADGRCTLFSPLPAKDDALWHGVVDGPEALRARFAVDELRDVSALEGAAAGLGLPTLAVPDEEQNRLGARLTGLPLRFGVDHGDDALVSAIIEMRSTKTEAELVELRRVAGITAQAFRLAMAATRPGGHEAQIAALFHGALALHGLTTGYHSIITVRGEILHNPDYVNSLDDGQLLLLDGGGEGDAGYTVDITRTWPVNGRFSGRQRAAYEAVLAAQRASIELVRPGVRYRDVHMRSAEVLAQFLCDEGLVRGGVEAALATHAHALFFPHGVGHLLGLDVHDLETYGDRPAYAPGRSRAKEFGTAYLRLDLDLSPGHVVTIEPGFYVVPAILHDPALRARFKDQVDWDRAESWIGFGGVRIEDDVVCTVGEPEVLTQATPKDPQAVEALIGQGPSALERLSL